MNWYKISQAKDILTSSYYDSDEEDERAINSLRQRYKRVSIFLDREDMDQELRRKLKVLRNWLAFELQTIYNTIRSQKERDELV